MDLGAMEDLLGFDNAGAASIEWVGSFSEG